MKLTLIGTGYVGLVTGASGFTSQRNTFHRQKPPACCRTISFRSIVPVTMIIVITTSSAAARPAKIQGARISNAVAAAANGRAIEKIHRIARTEGPQFYAYIADTLGPQLVTVNTNGTVSILGGGLTGGGLGA